MVQKHVRNVFLGLDFEGLTQVIKHVFEWI